MAVDAVAPRDWRFGRTVFGKPYVFYCHREPGAALADLDPALSLIELQRNEVAGLKPLRRWHVVQTSLEPAVELVDCLFCARQPRLCTFERSTRTLSR